MTTFVLYRREKYFAGFKDAHVCHRPPRTRSIFAWSAKRDEAFQFVTYQNARDFAHALRLSGNGSRSVRIHRFESGAGPDVGQPQPKPPASGDSVERHAPNSGGVN